MVFGKSLDFSFAPFTVVANVENFIIGIVFVVELGLDLFNVCASVSNITEISGTVSIVVIFDVVVVVFTGVGVNIVVVVVVVIFSFIAPVILVAGLVVVVVVVVVFVDLGDVNTLSGFVVNVVCFVDIASFVVGFVMVIVDNAVAIVDFVLVFVAIVLVVVINVATVVDDVDDVFVLFFVVVFSELTNKAVDSSGTCSIETVLSNLCPRLSAVSLRKFKQFF